MRFGGDWACGHKVFINRQLNKFSAKQEALFCRTILCLLLSPGSRPECVLCDGMQLPVGNLETALKELAPAVTLKAEAFLDSPKCGPLPKQTQAVVRARAAALKQAAAVKEESASGAKAQAGAADEKPAEKAPAGEKADV